MTGVAIELPDFLQNAMDISLSRCGFRGILYEAERGGTELRLCLPASDLEHLETQKVTWLRHQAGDQKEIVIVRFPQRTKLPALILQSRRSLREWVMLHCGLQYTFLDKVHDSFWMINIFLRLSLGFYVR